jgi:hypothetical protein
MEATVRKLRQLFDEAMPGSQTTVIWTEDDPIDPAVTLTIQWSGFEDMDYLDRQNMIWGIIEQKMDPVERTVIKGLFAETPAEHAALMDN